MRLTHAFYPDQRGRAGQSHHDVVAVPEAERGPAARTAARGAAIEVPVLRADDLAVGGGDDLVAFVDGAVASA
jgi:hypothetical protein